MTHRRHKVRFEQQVDVPNGGGGFDRTWQEVVTVRCEVERLQSFRFDVERVQGGGQASMPLLRIHCYSTEKTRSITTAMRAVLLPVGTSANINLIQDLEGNGKTLTITASENMPT